MNVSQFVVWLISVRARVRTVQHADIGGEPKRKFTIVNKRAHRVTKFRNALDWTIGPMNLPALASSHRIHENDYPVPEVGGTVESIVHIRCLCRVVVVVRHEQRVNKSVTKRHTRTQYAATKGIYCGWCKHFEYLLE